MKYDGYEELEEDKAEEDKDDEDDEDKITSEDKRQLKVEELIYENNHGIIRNTHKYEIEQALKNANDERLQIKDPPIENQILENAPNVGKWGGQCTCPDGAKLWAGDNGDNCGSLACINGISGDCKKKEGKWSQKKVICADDDEDEDDITEPGHKKFYTDNQY